jgi:hypothetical protein
MVLYLSNKPDVLFADSVSSSQICGNLGMVWHWTEELGARTGPRSRRVSSSSSSSSSSSMGFPGRRALSYGFGFWEQQIALTPSSKSTPRQKPNSRTRTIPAEPWRHDTPRLGASNFLIAQMSEDHRALCDTSLAIREPRPTKDALPSSSWILAPSSSTIPHGP